MTIPNFYSALDYSSQNDFALQSIQNVEEHLSQLSQTRTSMMGEYQTETPQQTHNNSIEKLNKGFEPETIKEFGLTKHDHIGGTFHKYNYVEKNIN